MTIQSDADKRAEALRDLARQNLIDHYIQVAITAADGLLDDDGDPIGYGFLNVLGQEVPDPTVVEPPLGYVAQPDLMEQMRRMVRSEMSRIAELQEFETFEEADDFDIDEDPVDYSSPYEMFFDPPAGAPAGPTGPDRPDPNAPPVAADATDRGGGGAEPPSGQAAPTAS